MRIRKSSNRVIEEMRIRKSLITNYEEKNGKRNSFQ